MGIDYQFRPITQWPGEMKRPSQRKRSTFRASYPATIRGLERELSHLRASKVVIEAALTDGDIRNDGLIRAGSRPSHPGVILSFQAPTGPLRFPCDTYNDWQENLRAIVLALDALRRVDRYGVTRRGEQYTGWKQLPSGITPAMTIEQAAEILCGLAGQSGDGTRITVIESAKALQGAYRDACKNTHPDLNGGTDGSFKILQEAKRVLDAHHGL